MCIEREKVDFKSREVNGLKECALALSGTKPDYSVITRHKELLPVFLVLQ